MNCSGLRTSRARFSVSSARVRLPTPDVNLPERRQRDPQAVRRPRFLLELDAPLGQRQRFLVPMLHRGDVRLVAEDRRQHVACLRGHGQPLGMAHRDERLFEPPFLRQRHARQRMDHGQMPPVARGVQGRRGRGQVLPDDRADRRPAGSRAPARIGRGRWTGNRAPARPGAGLWSGTRCRGTARPARRPPGRACARGRTVWPGSARSRASGGRPRASVA